MTIDRNVDVYLSALGENFCRLVLDICGFLSPPRYTIIKEASMEEKTVVRNFLSMKYFTVSLGV